MGTKSPGGPQRCRLILQHCLAIQLCKPGHTPDDFWMYDSGYMIFQNFLAANSQCWWNAPLTAATRALKYAGHVAPGLLLVTAEPCALEVLRGAYARSVLKPPATYIIHSVGDIDDCIVTPTAQGQFTPLTEALCDVIMDLTSVGQSATIENMKVKLTIRFPHMQSPSVEMIYDTLAQLMQEGKIYQTSKGYFIVTPERRRSRSHSRNKRSFDENHMNESNEMRTVLMTNSEALHSLYGEISTERDGDLTHQCIQTNLADVICGGNPNDKILYPRNAKRRSASFPTPRSLERRHSLRLFGSSKRLQRCASTRSLSKNYAQTLLGTDSSSSEYQSTDSSAPSKFKKKASLLSRLFRRSGRSKQRQLETYSAQFPPAEWFNSRAVHLHSVGTQTVDREIPAVHTLSNSTFYDGSELSNRSSTLPRRHHRRHMSSESTFVISSRDCSPIRRRSPAYCSVSLPRSTNSISTVNQPTKTSSSTSKQIIEERNTRIATSKGDTYRGSPTRILNDRNDKIYRNVQSGPSSLESGKASIMTTSTGPSSIESNSKHSYSRTSGHSSLESHCSTNTVQSPNRSFPDRMNTSNTTSQTNPSPKRQSQLTKVKMSEPQQNQQKSNSNSAQTSPVHQQQSQAATTPNSKSTIPNSNSNSSITLQVTTNTSSSSQHPSTKIYVQNSPVRSVITLENGKLRDNSNVFIINNETTTNANGDVLKRTLTRQNSVPSTRVIQSNSSSGNHHNSSSALKNKENYFNHHNHHARHQENDTISETTFDDSISMISEISPDSSLTPINNSSDNIMETSKFTKNINNDATMNNSRKLSLQINPNNNNNNNNNSNCNNNNSNNVYKNFLKNNETSSPTSPINNKNLCIFENSLINNTIQSSLSSSSIGNLRYFNDNNKMIKSVNENHHPNMMMMSPATNHHTHHNQQLVTDNLINLMKNDTKLNSNPTINKIDSNLANLLHKNIITVGSEPNLISIINKNNASNDNITTTNKIFDKLLDIDRDKYELRRLSLSKDINTGGVNKLVASPTNGVAHANGGAPNDDQVMYNFPSLTDLSFNFTSLAAQKILQGVSINSIDTLVELNMAANNGSTAMNGVVGSGSNGSGSNNQDKQQKNNMSPICTDYGMV